VVDIFKVIEEIGICFEMTSDKSRVHFYTFSFGTEQHSIVELLLSERIFEDFFVADSFYFVI
jgi:hypothetical protein